MGKKPHIVESAYFKQSLEAIKSYFDTLSILLEDKNTWNNKLLITCKNIDEAGTRFLIEMGARDYVSQKWLLNML